MGCGGAVPCWSAWPRGRGRVSVLGQFLADEGSNEAGGGCWRKVAPRPSVHSAAVLRQLRAVASSPLLCPALQLAGTPQCQHGQGNADCSLPASKSIRTEKSCPCCAGCSHPLVHRQRAVASRKQVLGWSFVLPRPCPAVGRQGFPHPCREQRGHAQLLSHRAEASACYQVSVEG